MFGSLATISADNLASHEIGGFRSCFNSGKICRFCMADYNDISKYSSETEVDFPRIRNASDHAYHVSSVEIDKRLIPAYGVVKKCAFSALESFDLTLSLPPDCMHDILEGVLVIDLKVVLRGLIDQKILTVATFNDRLQLFQYGLNERRNIPALLSESFPNTNLAGSAAQKWHLFLLLPFLIGDLVPLDNDFWDLYMLSRKMTDIIFAPVVKVSQLAYLDMIISQHHKLLYQLAPQSITPKCHFITHYPRLMLLFGPLRNIWCMRFEGYHSYLKSVVAGNFKNICKTLAERNQFRKCLEQYGSNCLTNDVCLDGVQRTVFLRSLPSRYIE